MNLNQFSINGKFLMLALDHRESFKKLINPENPESVTDEQVIGLKTEIIKPVENQFSGVLIDIEYGLKAYIDKIKPFLLPIEKSGFVDQNGERLNVIQSSVDSLRSLGAHGAKLLIYFNPDVSSASQQINLAKQVMLECQQNDFPFFLEIVTYQFKPDDPKSRADLVLRSIDMFIKSGVTPNVWKLEYQGDIESCQKITQLVGNTPWILLTRGDKYDDFVAELSIAVKAGASGFLAGRALWQEVCSLDGDEKIHFLEYILPNRFKTISDIVTG